MRGSLYVGKLSGIKVFIHWTFLILLTWVVLSGAGRGYGLREIMFNLGLVVAIFGCITLHELGHALTAKRFHFKTRDITLLPIGGVARMESLPDKPLQEFLVAVMGPAVNLAISLVLYGVLKFTNTFPESLDQVVRGNFWFQLYAVNISLVVFNLIPAFPMDGGRVLRALLSIRLPRVQATRIATYVGQFIAVLFIFFGFFYNPFLTFIGLFIFIVARAEVNSEEAKAALGNIKVGDLLMHHYSVLGSRDPLSKAVSLMLDSQDRAFIVKDDGEVKGTLSEPDIIEGLSKFGREAPVEHAMKKPMVFLHGQDRINEIIHHFSDGSRTLMPVVEGQEMVGVLNLENIHEFIRIQATIRAAEKIV